MTRAFRWLVVVAVVLYGAFAGIRGATADITNSDADNVQSGDNSGSTAQAGAAGSGDAVGGQVTGLVSSGDTSVDARNESTDADVETGAAVGANSAGSFVGQNRSENANVAGGPGAADIEDSTGFNLQDGDNDLEVEQVVSATTGDGVAGQVIGAVTSAGGSADIVAANTSEDVDVATGEATSENFHGAFIGLNHSDSNLDVAGEQEIVDIADITGSDGTNLQDGDNELSTSQASDAATGDGVAGQVLGAVSAGDTSIDARNSSEDVDLESGDAVSGNRAATYVGLAIAFNTHISSDEVIGVDIVDSDALNQQDGENEATLDQDADATSGDAVGGQVAGAVSSSGGSADLVLANESEDVDIATGLGTAENLSSAFVGLSWNTENLDVAGELEVDTSDIEDSTATNMQEGDNSLDKGQTAIASTGDGVGGQVMGVVSAGDASIDARNRSEDVDIESGSSEALNASVDVVGLVHATDSVNLGSQGSIDAADINSSTAENLQEGDNDSRVRELAQSSSGDSVGGQVSGAVVSAGGSVDAVLDNESVDIDAESGDNSFVNRAVRLVGHAVTGVLTVTTGGFESCERDPTPD